MSSDIQAPSTPSNLSVPSKTSSSISLSWTASTDNIVVSKYEVYRDGVRVGETSDTKYTDAGLSPNTTHSYAVKAIDGAGNASSQSVAVSVTTDNWATELNPGEAYLEDLAAEAKVTLNGNTITIDGKTKTYDSTNSRIVNGKIAVKLNEFLDYFSNTDWTSWALSVLSAMFPGFIIYNPDLDMVSVRGSKVTPMSTGTRVIVQTAAYDGGKTSTEAVKSIQQALMNIGCWTAPSVKKPTGYFKDITKESLIKFQTEYMGLSYGALFEYSQYNSQYEYVGCGPITAEALTYSDVVIAKRNLHQLGYGDSFNFWSSYTDGDGFTYKYRSGRWSDYQGDEEFNKALWKFIDDQGKRDYYINVTKYDISTLFGWLQAAVDQGMGYPPPTGTYPTYTQQCSVFTENGYIHYSGNIQNTLEFLDEVIKDSTTYQEAKQQHGLDDSQITNKWHYLEVCYGSTGWLAVLDAELSKIAVDYKERKITYAEMLRASNVIRDLIKVSYMGKYAVTHTESQDDYEQVYLNYCIRAVASDEAYQQGILTNFNMRPALTGYNRTLEIYRQRENFITMAVIGLLCEGVWLLRARVIKYAEQGSAITGSISASKIQTFKAQLGTAINETEAAYNAIRNVGMDDISTVARNTGLSVDDVTKLKNHLFFDEHLLPQDGGQAFRLMRFEADDEIAYAWKVAQQGELTSAQKTWFQQLKNHELGERALMDQGIPYRYLESWDPVRGFFTGSPKGAHELAPVQPAYGTFPGFDPFN